VDLGANALTAFLGVCVVEVAQRCSSRCRSFSLRLVALVAAAETSSRAATARDPRSEEARRRRGQFPQDGRRLLGGAAGLIGAGFAYLQFSQAQQTSLDRSLARQKASQEQLVSNQVSKGFELLGNKDGHIEQRLGGIYALEG
jgi:hypothetical protein